jgi:predicted RND superfamily exporter protein
MKSRANAIHQSVENAFESWGQMVDRRAGWIIVAVVLITLGLGSQLRGLTIDASTEGFLRPDNPARLAYDEFRERFGRDQMTVIAVEPPETFDIAFLTKLRDFHDALEEEVPMLEDINGLANARSTYGEDDVLNVDDLLEEIPQTPEELAAFRKRVMESPSYRNLVISEDGTISSIVIESDAYSHIGMADGDDLAGFGEDFGAELGEGGDGSAAGGADRAYITSAEEMKVVAKIREIAARFEGPDFRIDIGGNQVFPLEVQAAMGREMPRFLAASLLVIGVLLYILFRRISAVVLPLLVVILAIIATLSLMAIFGIAIKITTQVLPTFLLAVGIGYTVHLLNGFYMRLDTGSDRTEALIGALRHTGLPIVMTGVTTMVGVLSFTTAEMAPVGDFGWVTAAGVTLTLFYSLALLPALLVTLPLRAKAPRRMLEGATHESEARSSFVLAFCARISARHPWPLAIGTALLLLIALILIPQIKFSANPLLMLPYEHPTRVTQRMLDARMGGGLSFEVLVETGRENAMKDPALLKRMAKIEERVAEYDAEGEHVGRTMSVLDVVRETHQALNENRSAYYTIPDDSRLLAQELILFENSGSDDLERLVDSLFTQARMTVRADFIEPMDRVAFLERAEREFGEIMGDLASVRITGIVDVMTYTASATVRSVVSSYTLAFAMITPLMMLLIGSLRAGLVSMVPNLVPILLTLGLMVVLDIPLDGFTLLVGCIAVGLAVDDTIHLIHGFRRELASGKDPETAIRNTLETTGRALLFTTVILCSGFVVFWLSSMDGLQKFGFLISFAVATALLLDILVTPALLLLVTGREAKAPGEVAGGSAAPSATPASPVDPGP